jgi:hypothetical protein
MVLQLDADVKIVFTLYAETLYNLKDIFAVVPLEPNREQSSCESLSYLDIKCAPY